MTTPPETDRDPLAPLPNPDRADGLSVTRWTDRARAALVRATARAAAAGRSAVADRDLLDGLLDEPACLACEILARLGVTLAPSGPPSANRVGPLPFEAEAAAAVRAACVVACQVSMVDTTHLLLALAGGRGEAAAALTAAGATPFRVRLSLLPPGPPAAPASPPAAAGPTPTEAAP